MIDFKDTLFYLMTAIAIVLVVTLMYQKEPKPTIIYKEITPQECTDKVVWALSLAFPYDYEKNFVCIDRAKAANDILWKIGYQPEIKMGMDIIYDDYFQYKDECAGGEQQGHAWIVVDGKEYWKGNYEWSRPYTDAEINYFMDKFIVIQQP